jgi:hypothetical protein
MSYPRSITPELRTCRLIRAMVFRIVTQAARSLRADSGSSDPRLPGFRRSCLVAAWAATLLLLWVAIRAASPRVLARFFRVPHVPSGDTPAQVGLQAEDVTIEGPRGRRLRAWFVPVPAGGPQPAAVVLHGWTGSASLMLPIVRPLLAAGLHVLLLDARCHGRSDDDSFSSMPDFATDSPDPTPGYAVGMPQCAGLELRLSLSPSDEQRAQTVPSCLSGWASPIPFPQRRVSGLKERLGNIAQRRTSGRM